MLRYEVVMAIVATAKKNFEVFSESEELLNFVKERTLDKKFKVRNSVSHITEMLLNTNYFKTDTEGGGVWIGPGVQALLEQRSCLSARGHQKGHHLDQGQDTARYFVFCCFCGKCRSVLISNFQGYYMPGMDDRLLVERLINTCLVPFSLDSKERMKKLLLLYGTIDDNASKAFIEVQKNQFLIVRKAVAELVALHRVERSEETDKEIQLAIVQVFVIIYCST